MFKTKFFQEDHQWDLEEAVNKFIRDKNKNVINISYTVAPCGYGRTHYCCVLYED